MEVCGAITSAVCLMTWKIKVFNHLVSFNDGLFTAERAMIYLQKWERMPKNARIDRTNTVKRAPFNSLNVKNG